jgi:hypothetical protein
MLKARIKMSGPLAGVGAGLLQKVIPEHAHKPDFLRERDENARRDRAQSLAVPPCQSLESDDPIALKRNHRLIIGNNEIGGDRRAQLVLDPNTPVDMGVHLGLEKSNGRTAFALGAIKRTIGTAYSSSGVIPSFGR